MGEYCILISSTDAIPHREEVRILRNGQGENGRTVEKIVRVWCPSCRRFKKCVVRFFELGALYSCQWDKDHDHNLFSRDDIYSSMREVTPRARARYAARSKAQRRLRLRLRKRPVPKRVKGRRSDTRAPFVPAQDAGQRAHVWRRKSRLAGNKGYIRYMMRKKATR